jgi:hypothetical protein
MGVVIEICVKYPGGRTRIKGTDIRNILARSSCIGGVLRAGGTNTDLV